MASLFDDLKNRISNTGRKLGDLGFNKYFFSPDVTKNTVRSAADTITGIPTYGRGIADAIVARRYQPQIEARNQESLKLDNQAVQAAKLASSRGKINQARSLLNLTGNQQNLERDILGRELTTPEAMRDASIRLAGTAAMGYTPGIKLPAGQLATRSLARKAAEEALPVLSKARPMAKLAGFTAIRGAENALPGVAINAATGAGAQKTLSDAKRDFAMGAAANVLFSPKLSINAARDAKNYVKTSAHTANFVDKLDKQLPSLVDEVGADGRKFTTVFQPQIVEVPNSHARFFAENGRLPKEGEVVPEVYNEKGTSRLYFDGNGKLVSWNTSSPEFAKGVEAGLAPQMGMSVKPLKPSQVEPVKNPIPAQNALEGGSIPKEVGNIVPTRERGLVTSVHDATNPNITAETKTLTKGDYVPKPNKQLMGEAKALLTEGGSIDFKNTQNLDQKVAATIQEAINQDAAGNHEAAAALYNNLAEHGTNLGRGVQAFSLLDKMSPEAISISVARKIQKVNAPKEPEITRIAKQLEDNLSATTRIESSDVESVINKLTPEQKLAKRISATVSKKKKAAQDTLVNELFNIAKTSLPEKAKPKAKSAISKIKELFSLDSSNPDVYAKAKEIVRERFGDNPAALEKLDQYFASHAEIPISQVTVRKALNEAVKEQGVQLSKVVLGSPEEQAAFRASVLQKLKVNGISDEQAKILAGRFSDELAAQLKTKQLAAIEALRRVYPEKSQPTIMQKIEKLKNLGVLDNSDYLDIARSKLGIPNLTGEQQKIISDKVEQIRNIPVGRDRNIAIHELENIISGFIPSSFADKAITVWKAGLLTSLRTHERNFIGNAINGVAEIAKDVPAAAADMLMSGTTGKRSMSVAVRGMGEFGSKSTLQQMKDIVMKGFDPSEQINKFDYKKITWKKTPVQRFLKFYTDGVFNTLGASDKPFYNAAFARSLYDQAGTEAINAGRRGDMAFIESLVKSPTEDMVKNATIDASKATFKNKNAASQIAVTVKRAMVDAGQGYGGDIGGQIGKVASEITMPFTGVPSSIVGQTVAYSPIGLLNGIAKVGKVVVSNVPELQRQAAQELGRGVIGTGIYGLGAYLAGKGLITGQPKDAEEARLWDTQNKPRNSIMIGGKWRSLNSIGPETLVLLAGAKAQEEMSKPDGSIANYGLSLAKDQLDQSFLSGVQAPVNAITDPKRYAKSYIGNTLSSVIPNIGKDLARALDPVQREMNTVGDYVKGNIVGVRNTLTPKRDVLGNEMKQEPTGIWAFADPFLSKTPTQAPIINELNRLYQTGNGATPSKLGGKYTVFGNKVSLTPEELDNLEKVSGGALTQRLNTLINSDGYASLPDEQKAKLINGVVDEVRSTAKKSMAVSGSPATQGTSSVTGRPTKDQLDMAKFQVEQDQQTRKIGDTYVYYNPETGRAESRTEGKILNDTQIQQIENDLDVALKMKNYAAWRTAAEKQMKLLQEQTKDLDPVIDAAKILANQNKLQDLQLKYLTYQGYGGLSKPKKGKTLKGVSKVTSNRKPKLAKGSTPKSSIKTHTLKKTNLSTGNGTVAKKRSIRKSAV